MKRFTIIHGFNLQSAGSRLMHIGQIYSTESKEEIAELETFVAQGACALYMPTVVEEDAKPVTDNPVEDLASVPGVGKATLEKLVAEGITLKSELEAAIKDKEEHMKEVLGSTFEKIASHFVPKPQ